MQLLDHNLLARLGSLPLEARQPMLGNVSGKHRSSHRGSSVEFAEYRKYVHGDDTRRLDWKAYARSDRFYIKEFEADTNLRAYLVMDASGSMGFQGDASESKFLRAARIAASLAYISITQGDAVGMALSRDESSGKTLHIPTSRRPAHLHVLFDQMSKTTPAGKTQLCQTLHEIADQAPRRGLVLIFSDLFTDPEELKDALRHLKFQKHDIAVFHMMDDKEISFDFDRPMRFVDMESSQTLITEPSLIAQEYRHIIIQFLEDSRRACHDIHADYHLIRSHDSTETILRNFLIGRLRKAK